MTEGDILVGTCCACRQEVTWLRTIILLGFRAPTREGERRIGGWGCAVCSLPAEGAVAFVCDPCVDAGREILDYVAGDPRDGRRGPVSELTEPFAHDMTLHPAHEFDDTHEFDDLKEDDPSEEELTSADLAFRR